MFIDKKVDKVPQVGDRYVVKGVYPGTTDDLWKPSVEVYVEPETAPQPDEKKS